MKVYGIAYGEGSLRPALIDAAKKVALDRLAEIPATLNHYSVGFLGIHQGRTSNFVFIDWWAEENELHHHVYVSTLEKPLELKYVTPSGLTACVWDLRLMSFERDAWVKTVLQTGGKDFECYLNSRLNENCGGSSLNQLPIIADTDPRNSAAWMDNPHRGKRKS